MPLINRSLPCNKVLAHLNYDYEKEENNYKIYIDVCI